MGVCSRAFVLDEYSSVLCRASYIEVIDYWFFGIFIDFEVGDIYMGKREGIQERI